MLDGSDEGEINALAITREGEHFVSGGEDKIVKVWDYDQGLCTNIGLGHSGAITKIAFAPDQRTIISVGADGAIFIWRTPEEVVAARADNEMPTMTKDRTALLNPGPGTLHPPKPEIASMKGGKTVPSKGRK